MSFSIQTNVNSLVAQENLRVNSNFQSQTIQRLTSGYRINSSSDDAAGLAIANKYRSDVSELSQGVRNANDGVSSLQIADSGMSNISKMLDRLRTLATQSASSTFTGDRTVLNTEFQSLLTEIDRQAQSIGLNQSGSFAKSLSVFIGGGRASTSSALDTSNGTVTVDLRASTVDTTSLGLKGTQVKAGVSDIAASVLNSNNQASLADGKTTTFYFAGPGFSGGSKVAVTVDTTGLTNAEELATALNTAISTAAGGSSTAAQNLKAAGIVAGVNTDSTTGDKSLTFTSASSAFQVEAGDKMANALLGNLKPSSNEGIDMSSLVKGAVNVTGAGSIATPTSVKVRITGAGLGTQPVELTLNNSSTTGAAAAADIVAQVAANDTLKAAGITATGADAQLLTFTNAHGEHFNVQITGDLNNVLGYGKYQAGSVPASDYSAYTGAAYDRTTQYGTAANVYFSIDGGATTAAETVSVDLTQGDATKAAVRGTVAGVLTNQNLIIRVDGASVIGAGVATGVSVQAAAAAINGAAGGAVVASMDDTGRLVVTAGTAGGHTIDFVGSNGTALTELGLNAPVTVAAGQARSGQSIADALNSAFDGKAPLAAAGLKASFAGNQVTITSTNGTNFRLNADGANANIGLGTTGAAWAGVSNAGSNYNKSADANGTTATAALTYAAMKYGNDTQSLTISANDSTGTLQSASLTLSNNGATHTGRTIDEAVNAINTQLQSSNNATLKKIVAVKELGATETIKFVSSLTGFTVALGASANGNGFTLGGATGATASGAALGSGGTVTIDTVDKASQAVSSVASAISTLGTAQAAVGKGQNQLTYAIGLAQSQITNFSAAESRIRDADVASEAANLTKAQVLQQASIAAMAQANSAPQAVLSLLRG